MVSALSERDSVALLFSMQLADIRIFALRGLTELFLRGAFVKKLFIHSIIFTGKYIFMMPRFSLLIFLILLVVGCSGKQNSNSLVEDIILPPSIVIPRPSSLTLFAPLAATGNLSTPTIRVEGVQPGFTVTLYTDAACTSVLTTAIATGTSVDITTASLMDGVYAFYATAMDSESNISACSTAKADYTLITAPPVISGVSDDAIPRKNKSWNWSCSTSCTYRFVIDQSPTTLPTGAYTALTSADQLIGDGTYYLHLQAIDAVGNESAVVHVSALLDNTAPVAPTGLSLVTPAASPANVTTPVIRVSGVASGETVSVFADSSCTTSLGSLLASGATVDVTTSVLASGSYTFYARSVDQALNASSCSISSLAYVLDATPPSVVSILAPSNGAYSVGSTLDFQLNFSEVVTVLGIPCLEIIAGSQNRSVCYEGGSGNDTLNFSYVVQAGDSDSDGISFSSTNVTLNGGSIRDGVSNNSLLSFLAVAPNLSSVTVNTAQAAPSAVTAVTQTNLTSDRKNVSFIWSAPNGNGNTITKYIIRYKKESAS